MVYNMKNNLKYLPIGILTLTTAVSGFVLSAPGTKADANATATVSVGSACSFTTSTHTSIINAMPGNVYTTESDSTRANIAATTCNDPDGYLVQAAGQNGSTVLTGANTGATIVTGTNTSGGTSSWAVKVTSASSTVTSGVSVNSTYDGTYGVIPATAATLATYTGSSTAVVSGSMRTDYQVYVYNAQVADTYEGTVEYTISVQ